MSWPEAKLDELGFVGRGRSKHRPRNDPALYGGETPFIQTADIQAADLFISGYCQTYSPEGVAQSRIWDQQTLCMTIAGENTGSTAILNFPACFPDSIVGFIPNPELADIRYIKYSLDALRRAFRSVSRGATQDNLSLKKILSFGFQVPPLTIQQKVSQVIGAYDDLIETNRRRIALLEEATRLLYREWFVHFRFPGHEHVKITDGVPDGWERRTLVDLAEVVMGQSPKSQFYNDAGNGLPFHQGVTDYGFRFVGHRTYSTMVTKIAEAGDILVSVRAPVGRINITRDKIVLGRGLSAIRSRTGHQSFLFYALKNHFYAEDIIGSGAIYAATNKKELEGQKLAVPSSMLLTEFEAQAATIDQQIANLTSQNEKLAQARDLLLPHLMNGEIAV
ncbi:restriction endonuclease subunit S [Roseovarius arcticus]|uniref:restriction endonuclease subunit S n=1 Tax=Roseovarius arcticus TaxID=2547404 RepID=UPI001110A153|nr:restriction endonuclease subunit S [Roseovarius arcticus]